MDIENIVQIPNGPSKSVVNNEGILKTRSVLSNIVNTVDNTSKRDVKKNIILGEMKQGVAEASVVKNDVLVHPINEEDLELCDIMFFEGILHDDYSDILPKPMQFTHDQLNYLLGFGLNTFSWNNTKFNFEFPERPELLEPVNASFEEIQAKILNSFRDYPEDVPSLFEEDS